MNVLDPIRKTYMAIGVFDGVHLGHRAVVRRTVSLADRHRGASVVLTFDPHPETVISKKPVPLLTATEEKRELLLTHGADYVVVMGFTPEVASQSAAEFMARVILPRFEVRRLIVGKGFVMGKDRKGSVNVLRSIGLEYGFDVEEVEPTRVENIKVSSTRIRRSLIDGRVSEAERFLGQPYFVRGVVVKGQGRGRLLGFPTANLRLDPDRVLPARGVYAVVVSKGARPMLGVANVGIRPTFEDGNDLSVEAHILDFDGDVLGETLQLDFVERLRPERRFKSEASLRSAIQEDVENARELLTERLENAQTV
jgi:riboflavin kinase/FMN adenylyltransferase